MDWSEENIRHRLASKEETSNAVMEPYWQFYGLDFHRLGLAKQSARLLKSNAFDLCVQHFQAKNERGNVLVLHGYYDHVGLYKYLIRECLELGLSVTAFDLPGHGLSSGDRANIDSFDSYQDALVSIITDLDINASERWSIVGQSTGGAVIIDYLSRQHYDRTNTPFSNVVLLAPLVRPEGWLKGRILLKILRPFVDSIERGFSNNSHDQAFLNFIRYTDPLQHNRLEVDWVAALEQWIPKVERRPASDLSVSVIQGTDDETVDWRHNIGVIKKLFKDVSVFKVEDARHHLVCESQEFRNKVFTHLKRVLSALD